jgi:hypothetical protein
MPKDPERKAPDDDSQASSDEKDREAKDSSRAGSRTSAKASDRARLQKEDEDAEDEDAEDEDAEDEDDEDDDDEDEDAEDEDDEDDDDEDDDAEDEDAKQRAAAKSEQKPPTKADRERETRSRPSASQQPKAMLSEKVIDAPRPQTLGMLGAVCAATLIMWSAGRLACNYHPPNESRKPREVPTAELASDPKNAAIEVQQRWSKLDFARALELATGTAAEAIRAEQKKCQADPRSCDARRKQLETKIITTAALLQRESSSALVRVSTRGSDGPGTYLMELEPDGSLWKAKSRRPDTGQLPTQAPAPAPTNPAQAP